MWRFGQRKTRRSQDGDIGKKFEIDGGRSEYEANDMHRQALMAWIGLRKESKALNSAAVKREEIRQEEDEEPLEGAEKTRFRSLAATLNCMSLDRSDVQYAAKAICTKMMANPDTRKLEETEEGMQISERSGNDYVVDGTLETR